MKLNEEELSIIPSTPRYAKDHMDIYRNAEGYLDQFLDIDKDLKRYTFKDHNDWIQSYKREKEDHPTFFIKYWKKVVGIIMFREAYFMGGVQAVYFVHKKSASKGITSVALEQLVEVAFLTFYQSGTKETTICRPGRPCYTLGRAFKKTLCLRSC